MPRPILTSEEMDALYEASLHPYECDCELCVWFWSQMPPEAEPEHGDEGYICPNAPS